MNELRTILLVEDLDDDAFLFRRALRRAKIGSALVHVPTGAEAIEHFKTARKGEHPAADVVFVDLKLPGGLSGFDVLGWMKENLQQKMPVVWVLSSSAEPVDRRMAEMLGIHGYAVKPPDAELFKKVATEAKKAWPALLNNH